MNVSNTTNEIQSKFHEKEKEIDQFNDFSKTNANKILPFDSQLSKKKNDLNVPITKVKLTSINDLQDNPTSPEVLKNNSPYIKKKKD